MPPLLFCLGKWFAEGVREKISNLKLIPSPRRGFFKNYVQ